MFRGPFTVDQAEAVCAGDGLPRAAVAALLSRLVEQSLVQANGAQFWLLETLRTYADEQLDPAMTAALRRRHAYDTAERLSAISEDLMTPREPVAVATLTALVPDLSAAWEFAAAHDHPLGVRLAADIFSFAYLRQRLDLLRWALEATAWDLEHEDMPRALAAAAAGAWAHGELDKARTLVDRGIALAGGADRPAAADVLDVRADLDMFAGNAERAVQGYRTVAWHRRGDAIGVLFSDIAAAQARAYGPRRAELVAIVPDLLSRADQLGNPSALAFAHFVAGEVFSDHDVDAALHAYATAAEVGKPADSRLFVLMARTGAVALLARTGDPAQALEAFSDVLEHWEELGNRASQWWTLWYLVVLLDRIAARRDAAVLAGAISAARDRHESFGSLGERITAALDGIAARLGVEHGDDLTRGRDLSLAEAVALSRRAIRDAAAHVR